jgi:hypothetical protein
MSPWRPPARFDWLLRVAATATNTCRPVLLLGRARDKMLFGTAAKSRDIADGDVRRRRLCVTQPEFFVHAVHARGG